MGKKRIKILFLSADPRGVDYRPLLKKEFREIDARIKASKNHSLFKLKSEWAIRPEDLQDALLKYKPQIVHLSSHADRVEGVLLEDDLGNKKPVGTHALANLFTILKDNIRIVFLNACYTKTQMKAFSQTIDYTIGMRTPIGDRGAVVFAASFYKGLAFGLTVQGAFDLAINLLMLENIPDTKTPLLLIREGVDTSVPFIKERRLKRTSPKQLNNTERGEKLTTNISISGSDGPDKPTSKRKKKGKRIKQG